MNVEEAKRLLSLHSGRYEDIHDPKWQNGFLGSLRPFSGLNESNLTEVMECLEVLKEELAAPSVDRNIISDIIGMTYLARVWASPDGMLGRNNILTAAQTKKLLLWVDIIEECLMYLLDGDEEEAFFWYNEYLDGRK